MIRALSDFLDSLAAPSGETSGARPSVQLCMAVLLVEVMRADTDLQPSERDLVMDVLRRKFALQPTWTELSARKQKLRAGATSAASASPR